MEKMHQKKREKILRQKEKEKKIDRRNTTPFSLFAFLIRNNHNNNNNNNNNKTKIVA
jgi:hypothetical protein